MANYNTFLIKRRVSDASAPASLSGGELAFNEVGKTLYYGTSAEGVIAIGGEGSFATLGTEQTISGAKTFTNLTTLSSVNFSAGSVIDFNGNVLTDLGTPSEDSDASTKGYVDTEIDSLSSALQTAIDAVGSNGGSAVTNLSTEVYNTFVEKTESEAVTLNGGLTVTNGANVDNLTITGNLSVLGTQVVVNTETINISGVSTQIDIVNNGTATGLTVNQNGSQDVAEFKDDGATAVIIKNGGNVGIGTATPNEKLTVVGNISATGSVYYGGTMEVGSGAGTASLYVENGKVGINTETPNEELTIVGDVSATGDIFANNGDFTGALTVDQGVTFNSSLNVSGGVTFSTDLTGNGTTSTIYGFILDGGIY